MEKFSGSSVNRLSRSASLYQLTDSSAGSDTFVSPFSAELAGLADPRRPAPAPHKLPSTRVQEQTYAYDWLGNTTVTDDDLHVAFDRSLGTITNNTAAGKPYQLLSTSQSASPTQAGSVTATYDTAGNLLTLAINRTGTTCVGGNCTLSYDYQWDELGRLTRARRKEGTTFVADLRYTYDLGDQRVRKSSLAGGVTRHVLYVFDTLDVRGTQYNATAAPNDYTVGPDTEVPCLNAHGVRLARIVLEQPADGEPRFASTNRQHVFLTLTDHLGSSSATIDHATGELVELTTYQPYGATESDYRTDRWKSFREDYKFTGKEEDVEVGLQYFGKRFLSPYLGRWISPDPLAVHEPGEADLNLYAYVHGRVLSAIDPLGLDEAEIQGGHDLTAKLAQQLDLYAQAIDSATTALEMAQATMRAAQQSSHCWCPIRFGGQGEGFATPYANAWLTAARRVDKLVAERNAVRRAAGQASGKYRSILTKAYSTGESFFVKVKGYLVGRHSNMPEPRPQGMESHHGVMSAWFKATFGKLYDQMDAPAVLIDRTAHVKTFGTFSRFAAKWEQSHGIAFDFKKVSFEEMKALATEMFKDAKVPKAVREEYFRQLEAFKGVIDKAAAAKK